MQSLISKRHSLTELERLELKDLMREAKFIKRYDKKETIDFGKEFANLSNSIYNRTKNNLKKKKRDYKTAILPNRY